MFRVAAVRLRVDEHARVQDAGRVEGALRRDQRGGEPRGALAVVPGSVIAPDGVVMGDRAAETDYRLRGGGLDRVPLLDLAVATAGREDRVIRRGAVRIHVREAAREL